MVYKDLHIKVYAVSQGLANCGPQSQNLRPASSLSAKIYIFKTIKILNFIIKTNS